jgi:hypothetical protein
VAGALALAAALACASRADAEPVLVRHQPVRCLVAGRYPQLDACFEPPGRVARARVYFRPEGAADWYYVEMKTEAACFRGVLPRPKKSLKTVSYYVAVTDVDFAEVRTGEYAAVVVPDEKACPEGIVAPALASASVVVGGVGIPAGFVGGGVLAGVGTSAVVAGAAVVGAGAAGAVIVAEGGEEAPPTTTPPPPPTTTTTTTTLPSGCAADSGPPDVVFVSPTDNADVGARIDIVVEARDPGPVSNGVREVRIRAEEQGGPRASPIAALPGPGPRFEASWTLPPCMGPQDRWYVYAEAVDGCDRTTVERVRVRRRSDSCQAAALGPDHARPVLVWASEMDVPGGRGQVVGNGAEAAFPGPGRSDVHLVPRRGVHRVEALLVQGAGPGTWRFTLASGALRPGSLKVLAGEAVAVGPDAVAFRLRGRAGERVAFGYEVD